MSLDKLDNILFSEPFEIYAAKIKSLEPDMTALVKRIIESNFHASEDRVITDICHWLQTIYHEEKHKETLT
jgi:hypothetical protein